MASYAFFGGVLFRAGPFQVVVALAIANLLLSSSVGDAAIRHNSPPNKGRAGSSGRTVREAHTLQDIPALGPGVRSRLTAGNRQAVVVTGDGRDSSQATATLYQRNPSRGWVRVSGPWPAHNGLHGWTEDHRQGDRRSPIGVFRLTDAGGLLPDPGTRLLYDWAPTFTAPGTGSQGEPLTGSFDYVIAINYNRKRGTTPLDGARPLGAAKGGGIWIHVDHGGPTQGCISLPKGRIKELLRWLDPAKKPIVVMGDVATLGR